MTAGALSCRLTRLGPASGVEHAALHRLRHGVATYLDQGLPRHHLAALLACRGLGLAEMGKKFRRGRPGTRNLAVTRAGMRATLLSRQPWRGQEFMGGVRRLVDELCKYPGWRRDAARRARSGPVGPPANYQRKCGWLDGLREDQEGGRNRAGTRWLSTRDLWMGSQASADVRPAAGRRRIVHTGWFCQSAWFPNRSRPGLLAYRAREDGRCQPRAEQGPCDLSGRAGRGAAPPVAERADDVQPAAGLVEGAGRPRRRSGRARVGDRAQHPGPGLQQAEPDRPPGPGTAGSGQGVPQRVGQQLRYHDRDVWAAFCHAPPVQGVTVKSRAARTDPGSAPSARVAIRGSQGQRARAGSGDGRHLPLARPAISAAGISQRQPALPAG